MENIDTALTNAGSDWRTVSFEEIAKNITDRVDPAKTTLQVYVGLEHLDLESLRIKRWGTPADVKGVKLQVRAGDVIFGKRRAYLRKVAVADFDCICSAHAMVLRPNPETMAKDLFPFFIQSDQFMYRALQISVGSLSPTINWKTLAKEKFRIPIISKQRNISPILLAAEECIAKNEKLSEEAAVFKRVIARSLLTHGIGHTRMKRTAIGEIPEEWEVVELKDVSEIVLGQSPPSSACSKEGVGLAFLQGKTNFGVMYPSPVEYCSKPMKIAEAEDILISVRAPVGDVNLAPYRLCIGRGLGAIRPDSRVANHMFYFYYLQNSKNRIETLGKGSTFKAIVRDDLEKFKVPLPPLPEQKKIADILLTADSAVDGASKSTVTVKAVKMKLINSLLPGGNSV